MCLIWVRLAGGLQLTLTLSLHCWVMGSAHHLTKANIWPKFNKYLSKGWGDMEWTWNSRLELMTFTVTLTLSRYAWVMGSAHHLSLRQTFDQHLKKILPGVKEIWSRHQIQGSNLWPSTVTLTLSPQGWVMGSAHCPTEVNIWLKFRGIQGSNPWPWTVTLTLSQHGWVIDSAHHLTEVNIWPKYKESPSTGIWDTERTRNSRLKPMILTLTLCRHGWVISSAHRLTEANIWPKFKENPSKGIGDMERTRNSRLKPLTCDPDLELTLLTYRFCTSTHWGEHLTKV